MATIGRPSLERALASIKPQPQDEIIVVSRYNEDARALASRFGARYFDYPHASQVGGGAAERQFGIEQAKGDYLVFLDDDDVIAAGGLELVRAAAERLASPLPLLFRVQEPGGYIWGEQGPSLTLGEVTGSQFVPPNAKLADWPLDASGDQPFIEQTIANWGGYKAVDQVIITIKPERIGG